MFSFTTHVRRSRRGLRSADPGPRPAAWVAAAAGLVACMAAATSAAASTSTASAGHARVAAVTARHLDVTSLADSGPGTLRAAIKAANAGARRAPAVIGFSVAGTIVLRSALPAVLRSVIINATSAPGYASGGSPVVEIDCRGHAGLRFAAGAAGSELLGVAVDGAGGNGVTIWARAVTLDHDYIGLDLVGGAAGNRGDGVYVAATSSGDRIGLNDAGVSSAVANVISGNGGNGIVLAGSSRDVVVANRIGTSPAGTRAIGNRGDGILVTGSAARNEIGGTEYVDTATGEANNPTGSKGTVPPVFVVPPLGNLVSGNGQNGVLIDHGARDNSLNGNFVGTTASGDAPLGNLGNGVWIDGANRNSLTGCKFVNNPFVYYNVLSANGGNGLRVTNADGTIVQGNFFGVAANNTTPLGNRGDGILVDGSSANVQVGGVIPLGNVSSGNRLNGIEVTGRVRGFTTFNTFGGLLAFKGAAPNGNDGLLITSTGGGNLVRTNVFSGNQRNGIQLSGDASGVTVEPNIAGLTTNGKAALPNGGDGVLVSGNAHGNVIGGSLRSVIPQNTFSGNVGYGLAITGRAHGNLVFTSFIGTSLLGTKAMGNRAGGVLIAGSAYGNFVGKPLSRQSNLISGNTGNGVTLLAGTSFNHVISNYIGLDRFGRPLPNSGKPVVNRGRHNLIRGNRY